MKMAEFLGEIGTEGKSAGFPDARDGGRVIELRTSETSFQDLASRGNFAVIGERACYGWE